MSEQSFELADSLVPDIVPHLKNREVCPPSSLGATVAAKAGSQSPRASPSHADVDNIVVRLRVPSQRAARASAQGAHRAYAGKSRFPFPRVPVGNHFEERLVLQG